MIDIKLPLGLSNKTFVVYSEQEEKLDGAGFWSNSFGWVQDVDEATQFTADEVQRFKLPIASGNDARWIPIDEARARVIEHAEAFEEAVRQCLNLAQDGDACCRIYALAQDGTFGEVRARQLDQGALENYAFVLFDGAEGSGTRWRCAIFPKNKVFKVVRDS